MQGEIVLVMSDIPKGKALAKCYFIERSSKYTLNQRICSLSATGVNPKYLFYYLNRNKYFLGFDNGVSQTNLKRDEVINCPVVLPPPSEQNAIAEIITSLEDEISILKAKLSKSHFLKNGMMQELLTGRIRLV